MTEVTLAEILQSREDRVRKQQELLQEYGCSLICFTMNIAGPIKNTPLIQRGFRAGLTELDRTLPKERIRKKMINSADTGDTAMFAVEMDAVELKKICTEIEERSPLGRLFDMDVLDKNGFKLDRKNLRGCIVCGAPGRNCAAGRIHPITELQNITSGILREHFAKADREYIASVAVQSLIDEVNTTPKPGLVDRRNTGSHKDMNIHHFLESANALQPYFALCVKIGQETNTKSVHEAFSLLRQAGLEAENTMYAATGGVNTHKGVIYTLGVLCGSLGRLWSAEKPIPDVAAILTECGKIVRQAVAEDFASADGSTAGERLYLKYGLGGIRAEAAAGLPSVSKTGLPAYRKALAAGLTANEAGAVTLLHLIANVKDTNLYHRGGKDGAQWASVAAAALLKSETYPSSAQIELLDDEFIARNLSPGGCADLLAVTYFLHTLQQ